jgi:metal-responsive CopG/Arc/MetJ family transcriptional regulator
MPENKLVIKARKYGGETSVISVRLPKGMLAAIDQVASDSGRTRNEIIITALEYALVNTEINK